jgi:hypothetical protein
MGARMGDSFHFTGNGCRDVFVDTVKQKTGFMVFYPLGVSIMLPTMQPFES